LLSVVFACPGHRVQDGEQFSGASGYRDFEGLPGCLQALAEGLEAGIAAGCDEGGDVERAPDICSSAPDLAFAAEQAAVPSVRREARQSGDPTAIKAAKLWQARDQCRGDQRSDARGRAQLANLCAQLLRSFEKRSDLGFDCFKIALESERCERFGG
jgi:hypothetical protein